MLPFNMPPWTIKHTHTIQNYSRIGRLWQPVILIMKEKYIVVVLLFHPFFFSIKFWISSLMLLLLHSFASFISNLNHFLLSPRFVCLQVAKWRLAKVELINWAVCSSMVVRCPIIYVWKLLKWPPKIYGHVLYHGNCASAMDVYPKFWIGIR